MTDHSSPENAGPEGYTEAEGYAASLRQQADLMEKANAGKVSAYVAIDDFDVDELREAADFIERISAQCAPDGLANLRAIVADQPFQNSGLSVHEINLILANDGGFMPDEAVMWFRASRGTLGISAITSPERGQP